MATLTYRPGLSELNLVLAASGAALWAAAAPLTTLDLQLGAALACLGGLLANVVRRAVVAFRGHGAVLRGMGQDLALTAVAGPGAFWLSRALHG